MPSASTDDRSALCALQVDAAVRQANRETTNVLNTDEKKHRRYGRLTALEPSPVALAPASRLRSERHAAWHAQRALEPALDDAWSRARECELVDTLVDGALPPLHQAAA